MATAMMVGGAASLRANVDFNPLIDHLSALEYATKYATKQEKGSKMVALASKLDCYRLSSQALT